MNLSFKLLLYLDTRHILNDMKNKCLNFIIGVSKESLSKFPPIEYSLHLDVMKVLDFSPELGDFLIKEPLMFKQFYTDIFFACLKSIDNDEMNYYIRPSQVTTSIRLTSLPPFLFNPMHRTYNRIVAYSGLLVDITKPTNYVYHTVWSCPEECEDNEVILHYTTKIAPKCYLCRSTLFENKELKRCFDQVTATFLIKDELFGKKFTIHDELISELKLGLTYIIHVVILKTAINVWSIEEVHNIPSIPSSALVCSDIEELYLKCESLPWKFIYCLSSCIGSNIRPLNSFMNVKLNLLLSICSVKANRVNESEILHFLASGYDTGFIEKLMMYAAKLANRFTSLGISNTSVSTILLSASGGVCIMPLPFHIYSDKQNHSILSAVETGEIVHEIGNVKLRCAVWAHGMDIKKILLRNISNVFQNMSRGDYGEYHNELADFILQEATDPIEIYDEQILKDVSFYLDTVAGINVSLDIGAEHLLKKYFLSARRIRPKYVTSGSMKALVNVCLTIARTCRRAIANINDAIFSIWLHLSGIPEPRFAPAKFFETPANIYSLHKSMCLFKEWLELFCNCQIF